MKASTLKRMAAAAAAAVLTFACGSLMASEGGHGISPDKAFKQIKDGNARFATSRFRHPNLNRARMKETSEKGQFPIAAVVGCSDSRVPAELVFDQGIGDLFIVRVAGNVSDIDEVGSVEYAVEHLNVPLIIVLGHSKCGAVTAVVKNSEVTPNIAQLVDNIKPAVEKARQLNPEAQPDTIIPDAIRANVEQSMSDMLSKSPLIREMVEKGKVKLVGGIYDLATGKIEWIGEEKKQTPAEKQAEIKPKAESKHKPEVKHAEKPAAMEKAKGKEKEEHAGTGADAALKKLQEGNTRYTSGRSRHPNGNSSRRKETSEKGQHPFATVLACSDSRQPVEMIFDQGIGDIFVLRVAGNVIGDDQLASLEYAVEHLGTNLIVVMGHEKCGAVAATVKNDPVPGNIAKLVNKIRPAVAEARKLHPEASGESLMPSAIESNTWQSIEAALNGSELLREAVKKGHVRVVGAFSDLDTGKVIWLGPHPKQLELLGGGI